MIQRRKLLRGMVGGAAVTMGLPLLDSFLNSNGTALADGHSLPVRFGTWTWGCGMQASRWVPKTVGSNFEFPEDVKSLEPFKKKVSMFSGFAVKTDGRENQGHRTGSTGIRCGTAPAGTVLYPLPTIDVLVSDVIGGDTRFRSVEMSAMGNPTHSYSARSTSVATNARRYSAVASISSTGSTAAAAARAAATIAFSSSARPFNAASALPMRCSRELAPMMPMCAF